MALRDDVIFPAEVFGPVWPTETFLGDLLVVLIFAQSKRIVRQVYEADHATILVKNKKIKKCKTK